MCKYLIFSQHRVVNVQYLQVTLVIMDTMFSSQNLLLDEVAYLFVHYWLVIRAAVMYFRCLTVTLAVTLSQVLLVGSNLRQNQLMPSADQIS